jgi:hypothetical protein
MMSFVSSILIGLIEKQLVGQTPEIESFALNFIGEISADLVQYVEKKIAGPAPALQTPPQATQNP